MHQFRQAYDFDRTELGQFGDSTFDRAVVHGIEQLDRTTLDEARRLFTISRNVAHRLERSTGLTAEVLPPPPQKLPFRRRDTATSCCRSGGSSARSAWISCSARRP